MVRTYLDLLKSRLKKILIAMSLGDASRTTFCVVAASVTAIHLRFSDEIPLEDVLITEQMLPKRLVLLGSNLLCDTVLYRSREKAGDKGQQLSLSIACVVAILISEWNDADIPTTMLTIVPLCATVGITVSWLANAIYRWCSYILQPPSGHGTRGLRDRKQPQDDHVEYPPSEQTDAYQVCRCACTSDTSHSAVFTDSTIFDAENEFKDSSGSSTIVPDAEG